MIFLNQLTIIMRSSYSKKGSCLVMLEEVLTFHWISYGRPISGISGNFGLVYWPRLQLTLVVVISTMSSSVLTGHSRISQVIKMSFLSNI